MCQRMIRDQMAALRRFSDKFRALPRIFSNHEECRSRVVAFEQIEQLWSQRRIRAIVKGNRKLARRVCAANGRAKYSRARMDGSVAHCARTSRKRRADGQQRI